MKKQYVSPACIAVDCRIDQPLLDESYFNNEQIINQTDPDPTEGGNIHFGPPYFYTGFGDE